MTPLFGLSARRLFCALLPLALVACGDDDTPQETSASSTSSGGGGAAGGMGAGGGTGGGGGTSDLVYANPVVPGDFPDPSVIRVGSEYWATATTSEWAPHYPLLHSMDLVNWEPVGWIFSHPPAWAGANFWAPEISEDNGTYYVFYTAHQTNGPLCVGVASAAQPAGPYQDHGPLVCQPDGSIDGFSIRDENGARYLIWKEDGNSVGMPTPIWAQELSDDGTQLLGQPTALFQNDPSWEANLVEGPFLLKYQDYFYAFYSGAGCCGKDCSYALGVARSPNLLGPWEKNPANPILAGNGTWKCPGHGSIVATEDGRYYLLYHAYSVEDSVYVGRQGMLDEVVFGADGWPTINSGMGPSASAPWPIAPQTPKPTLIEDEFDGAALGAGWQWPVGIPPQTSIDPSNGGWLILGAIPEGPGNHVGAVVARSTQRGDYEVVTRVSADAGVQAGITASGDPENALGISVGDGQVLVFRLGWGMSQMLASASAPSSLSLRMTVAHGHVFSFATSLDGTSWVPLGAPVDSQAVNPDLPPWDRGLRAALFAKGPAESSAKFDFFRMTLPEPNP